MVILCEEMAVVIRNEVKELLGVRIGRGLRSEGQPLVRIVVCSDYVDISIFQTHAVV